MLLFDECRYRVRVNRRLQITCRESLRPAGSGAVSTLVSDLAHSHSIVLQRLHISLSGICLETVARAICSLFSTTNGHVDSETLPHNELLRKPPILVRHTVAVVDVIINVPDEHNNCKTIGLPAPHTKNIRHYKRR
jgi:hypothetical protein